MRRSNFPDLVEKEQLNLTSTGLIINGTVWVKNLYLVPNKSQTISFWILEAILLWITICLGVQSHPKDQGDFGQGLAVNISECNNRLELSVYNMCCSYMALTNPHMKHWIQFIIMKIFMKILIICPKSPRFTVLELLCKNRVSGSSLNNSRGHLRWCRC